MFFKEKEAREIEKRLGAYLQGDRSEFVSLEDVLDAERKNTQKARKEFDPPRDKFYDDI